MEYGISVAIVGEYLPTMLRSFVTTIALAMLCILLGSALGFVISLMRTSKISIWRIASTCYVEWTRGTPLLIQLFWIFFCLPILLHIELTVFASSAIALTLYMGAITSETFRAALKAIAVEHDDAGAALGLNWYQRAQHVILPQAFILAIPSLLSNSVTLLKETSLVSAIGMSDLMFVGQNIATLTLRPVEILTTVGVLYMGVALPITLVVTHIEKRVRLRFGF